MSRPKGVHLVGSVPLNSTEEVFRTLSERLGDRLTRMPDGETGPRALWISYQLGRLSQLGVFDFDPSENEGEPPSLLLKAGVSPSDVDFGELGYAEVAKESFAQFDRLQQEGVIPEGVVFEVAIPTPMANSVIWLGGDPRFPELDVRYTEAYKREVETILEALPHDRISVQWDVCVEVWIYEGWFPSPYEDFRKACVEHVAAVGNWIDDDVDMGFHLCYGDWQHKHLQQPDDIANVVELTNGFLAGVERPVQFLHLPVPIDRDDDAYFKPLNDLRLAEETELYMGVIHYRDGAEGANRRIATAEKFVTNFGVATECGMGRRPADRGGARDTLSELLDIHVAVSEPVR